MHIEQKSSHLFARQPLSVLNLIPVIVMLMSTVALATIKLVIGGIDGPPLAVTISMLICAMVMATRLRWIPVLSIIVSIGYITAIYFQPFVPYHLTQPKADFSIYVCILLILMFLVIGLITSILVFVQNYFRPTVFPPRWFSSFLTAVGGIAVGAILIGAISQGTTTAITTTTYTNGVPTVHIGIGSFLQSSVTITKGAKLLLIDDGAYPHLLSNGSWTNGQAQPEQQSGAPTVKDLAVNGKNVEIGPFAVAGTYHIYCSIHQGMMLTITVQ